MQLQQVGAEGVRACRDQREQEVRLRVQERGQPLQLRGYPASGTTSPADD